MDNCIHPPDCVDLICDAPGLRGAAEVADHDPGGTRRERGDGRSAVADRAWSTTCWPSSRSDCAAARPSPSVLPVMKTIAIRRSLGVSQTSGARFAKQYDLNLSEPDE
jgi:hypothetical protein